MISILTAGLIFSLTLSLFFNFSLILKLRKKPKRLPSIELREFLADLAGGGAMAAFLPSGEVKHVPDSDISLRSPKNR